MSNESKPQTSHRVDVLVVIGQLGSGGTERHLLKTLPLLAARGIRIAVFAFKPRGALAPMFATAGVPVWGPETDARGWQGLWLAARALHTAVCAHRPRILHFYLPAAYLLGTLVTWRSSALRIMSRRGLANYHQRYPGVRLIEKFLHRRMHAVLANSGAVARGLAREGVPPERLVTIYNGVEEPRASDRLAARSAIMVGTSTLVLIMVANLIPYKGHRDLFAALKVLRDRLPQDWTLLLLGRDDGIGDALQAEARTAGINEHVMFVGSVPDVSLYLHAADIGVLCSHEEGFSNAVLEGMAAALPMVVTDVGGNREAITDRVHGRVVPPHQPHALADALWQLIAEPEARYRMGAAARDRARTQFSLATCVGGYFNFYRSLLDRAPTD